MGDFVELLQKGKFVEAEDFLKNHRNDWLPLKWPVTPDTETTWLIAALGNKRIRSVQMFLRLGVSPDDGKDTSGRFPLEIAVKSGLNSAVKLLLQHGANAHSRCEKGKSLMQVALDNRNYYIADCFLEHGGFSLNSWKDRKTILLNAIREYDQRNRATAKFILKHCPSLSNMRTGYEDWALLHVAVKTDKPQIVKQLLENGVDPNRLCRKHGNTYSPLGLAIEIQSFEMFKLLLDKGAEVNLIRLNLFKDSATICLSEELAKSRDLSFSYKAIRYLVESSIGIEELVPVAPTNMWKDFASHLAQAPVLL